MEICYGFTLLLFISAVIDHLAMLTRGPTELAIAL